MLPHRHRSCRSNLLSHPVAVYRHWANQFHPVTPGIRQGSRESTSVNVTGMTWLMKAGFDSQGLLFLRRTPFHWASEVVENHSPSAFWPVPEEIVLFSAFIQTGCPIHRASEVVENHSPSAFWAVPEETVLVSAFIQTGCPIHRRKNKVESLLDVSVCKCQYSQCNLSWSVVSRWGSILCFVDGKRFWRLLKIWCAYCLYTLHWLLLLHKRFSAELCFFLFSFYYFF